MSSSASAFITHEATCRFATANYTIGCATASSLQGPYTKPGPPWLTSVNTTVNGNVRCVAVSVHATVYASSVVLLMAW